MPRPDPSPTGRRSGCAVRLLALAAALLLLTFGGIHYG